MDWFYHIASWCTMLQVAKSQIMSLCVNVGFICQFITQVDFFLWHLSWTLNTERVITLMCVLLFSFHDKLQCPFPAPIWTLALLSKDRDSFATSGHWPSLNDGRLPRVPTDTGRRFHSRTVLPYMLLWMHTQFWTDNNNLYCVNYKTRIGESR